MSVSAPNNPSSRHETPRDRIVSSAKALIFAHGFSGLTGDLLAQEASVSKSTLYKHFRDLAAVFDAVVRQEADTLSFPAPPQPHTNAAFWNSLKSYGENLLHLLNRPEIIKLDRLMHEQVRYHTELGRSYFDQTYGRSLQEVTAMIAYGQSLRFIRDPEPAERLAAQLLGMWESLRFVQARLGLVDKPFDDPQAWAALCVNRLCPNDVW
jgi:TetR/AcrR family transcriptional regulator, mexJK operon transcriptional repressor